MTSVKPFLLTENGAIYGNTKRYFPNVSFEHHLFPVFPEETRIPDEIKANFAMVDEFTDEIIADAETWCEPEFEDANALVFYCNSIPDAGSVDVSGDGTAANPFRDLRHALKVIYCYYVLFCSKMKFVLNVSGTVDYSVELLNNNFGSCLLIDFEEADPVASSDGNISLWLRGVTIKNLVFNGKRINYPSGGYWTGDNLFLLNCDVETTEHIYASAVYNSTVKSENIYAIFLVKSTVDASDSFYGTNIKQCTINAESFSDNYYNPSIFLDSEINCDFSFQTSWGSIPTSVTFLDCNATSQECMVFMAKGSNISACEYLSHYCVDCDCEIKPQQGYSSFASGIAVNNEIYSTGKLQSWRLGQYGSAGYEILFKNNNINITSVYSEYELLPSWNTFDNNAVYDLYPDSDEFLGVVGAGGTPSGETRKINEYFNNNTVTVRVHGNLYHVEVEPGGPYGGNGSGKYNYNFSCTFTGRLFYKKDNWSYGIDYVRDIILRGTAPRCNQTPSYSYSLDPLPDLSAEPTTVEEIRRVFQHGYGGELYDGRDPECFGTFGLAQEITTLSEYYRDCSTCEEELYVRTNINEGNYTGDKCRYRIYGRRAEHVPDSERICTYYGCQEVKDFVDRDFEVDLHDCGNTG